ncbi:hypothetical protein ACFL2G_02985 [Candidatus Omnitrophota bacterium]
MDKAKLTIALQIITAALVGISFYILTPQLNHWKARCFELQGELGNKLSEFQLSLNFFSEKNDSLQTENAALKESNSLLAEKLEDLESKISVTEKNELQNEFTSIRDSVVSVSTKIEAQTANISEVKEGLKMAESYFTSDYSPENEFSGELIYKNGSKIEFDWMGSNFAMGSWSSYIYYSMSPENMVYQDTLSFKSISRIDFLDLTESEKTEAPKSKWPIKAKVTFIDGKTWDNVYLYAVSWKYGSRYSKGWVLCRVALWPKVEGYLNIRSIIFDKK